MVAVTCIHCGSDQLVRNGRASNDKQRYRCRAVWTPKSREPRAKWLYRSTSRAPKPSINVSLVCYSSSSSTRASGLGSASPMASLTSSMNVSIAPCTSS
ncbi:transposase [Kouleothrix sp.]|uniref:transposase n=1 Tax=Kouleothrix sp. TaxID=2779161 RepID=UPI003918BB23